MRCPPRGGHRFTAADANRPLSDHRRFVFTSASTALGRAVASRGQGMPITKGGENIPYNTYGFEVEFCSHDNSVFAFTHVDVARLRIMFAERRAPEIWTLETDSGNVLELVTPPLHFAHIDHALRYRKTLTDSLVVSIGDGRTFRAWADALVYEGSPFSQAIVYYYQQYRSLGQITMRLDLASAAEVAGQLTAVNVDDGINITAARLRLRHNADRWNDYVGETIVSRSEKDWGRGYGSQLNLPMTLAGYWQYVLERKLAKAFSRMGQILAGDDSIDTVPTDKLERWVSMWFWQSAIFTAFAASVGDHLGQVAGLLDACGLDRPRMVELLQGLVDEIESGDRVIPSDDFARVWQLWKTLGTITPTPPTREFLTASALLYVKVNKVLTGALGSLSEEQQLALQQRAFAGGSTEEMVSDGTEDLDETENRTWLEYHSKLKDLTGLWFKGAFEQVCLANGAVGPALAEGTWTAVLGFFITLMRVRRWDTGRIFVDEVADLRLDALGTAIDGVVRRINELTLEDCNGPPLPMRAFLDYDHAPPWEGRYDTMVDMIYHFSVGWTYLVEHRNN